MLTHIMVKRSESIGVSDNEISGSVKDQMV